MKKRVVFWVAGLVVALGMALLLVEVVPNPPLMAPDLHPTAGMVGEWKGTARVSMSETSPDDLFVQLNIGPNAEVTGWVGGAKIETARIANNRSWLGRWLRLRTDYILLGKAVLPSGGHRWDFQAPMGFQEGVFRGSLFIEGRPRRLSLFRVSQSLSGREPVGTP